MEPFRACPQYAGCNVNDCPLDPNAATHGGPAECLPGESRCKALRSTREGIAQDHGQVSSWAWTRREHDRERRRLAAQARWNALSPERQAALRANAFKAAQA